MTRLKAIRGGKAGRKEWVDRDGTGVARNLLGLIYEHAMECLNPCCYLHLYLKSLMMKSCSFQQLICIPPT